MLLEPTPLVVEDLMPGDIMSSHPRQRMAFGRSVMAVQRCTRGSSGDGVSAQQLAKSDQVLWLR